MPKIIPSEVMTPATVAIISISVPPLILEIDDAFESEHIIGGGRSSADRKSLSLSVTDRISSMSVAVVILLVCYFSPVQRVVRPNRLWQQQIHCRVQYRLPPRAHAWPSTTICYKHRKKNMMVNSHTHVND